MLELGLTWCQGKAIINSVNLEDGEERFELGRAARAEVRRGPRRRHDRRGPAAGHGGDARAQAGDRAAQLHAADREVRHRRARTSSSTRSSSPCGTGDEKYIGSAVETIEGIRLIKEALPGTQDDPRHLQRVSFGLPESGREVLNSVFLYHCAKAGLDLAIVNTEKLERYASIPEEERRLAEDLLCNRGDDPVAAFAAHFKAKGAAPKVPRRARRTAGRAAAAATSSKARRTGWSRTWSEAGRRHGARWTSSTDRS